MVSIAVCSQVKRACWMKVVEGWCVWFAEFRRYRWVRVRVLLPRSSLHLLRKTATGFSYRFLCFFSTSGGGRDRGYRNCGPKTWMRFPVSLWTVCIRCRRSFLETSAICRPKLTDGGHATNCPVCMGRRAFSVAVPSVWNSFAYFLRDPALGLNNSSRVS